MTSTPGLLAACLTTLAAAAAWADQPGVAWLRHANGNAFGSDAARAIATHADGTVSVTGVSEGANGHEDILTLRYSAGGEPLWRARFDGPERWIDTPVGIAVDEQGNTLVAGATWGGPRDRGGTAWDIVLLKYTADGALAWAHQYDGIGRGDDTPESLVIDSAGNAYIGGFVFTEHATDGAAATDAAVIKIAPSGELVWEALYDLPDHHGAGVRDIAIDARGDLVATGIVNTVREGYPQNDILTMKLSPDGEIRWARAWDGDTDARTGLDDGLVVGVNSRGEVFVAGMAGAEDDETDGAVLKYTTTGELEWVARTAMNGCDAVGSLLIEDRSVFATGARETGRDTDGFLLALDSAGRERWRHVFDEQGDSDFQEAHTVMRGDDGLLYVGLDWQNAEGFDHTVSVHDDTGAHLDLWSYDAGSEVDASAGPDAWAIADGGQIVLCGHAGSAGRDADFAVMAIDTRIAPCAADFNNDGAVNNLDVFAFLEAWNARLITTDFDPDGAINSLDVVAFLAEWISSC